MEKQKPIKTKICLWEIIYLKTSIAYVVFLSFPHFARVFIHSKLHDFRWLNNQTVAHWNTLIHTHNLFLFQSFDIFVVIYLPIEWQQSAVSSHLTVQNNFLNVFCTNDFAPRHWKCEKYFCFNFAQILKIMCFVLLILFVCS